MGRTLRRFWAPFLQSSDSAPMRSRQLNFAGLDKLTLAHFDIALDTPEAERPDFHNGFHQDRAAMCARRSLTGLAGPIGEDAAIAVSSGPIRDRTLENLCPPDIAVAGLYEVLLKLARAETPITSDNEEASKVLGWTLTFPPGDNWRTRAPEMETRNPAAAERPEPHL